MPGVSHQLSPIYLRRHSEGAAMKTESAVASGVGPSVSRACVAGMVARGVEFL